MHCNAVTVLCRSYSVLVLELDEEACRSVHTTGWGMKPKGIVDGIHARVFPSSPCMLAAVILLAISLPQLTIRRRIYGSHTS